MENKLIQLYSYERSRSPAKFSDAIYHENARFILPEDNLYRIECVGLLNRPRFIYTGTSVQIAIPLYYEFQLQVPSPTCLTVQLVKNEQDKPEETAIYMDPAFAAYLNDELLSVPPERKGKHKIFLRR